MPNPDRLTLTYHVYACATALAAPFVKRKIRKKMLAARIASARINERFGVATAPRPQGKLIWIHTVSVGEFLSVLELITDLTTQGTVLVTTTTATAAALAAQRLAPECIHQYAPLDTPQATRKFLSHWQPDLAIFVESEIWPNQIVQAHHRHIPLALINARLSARSLEKWAKLPKTARALLSRFDVILAQADITRHALEALGAPSTRSRTSGDMKAASNPLPFDAAQAKKMREQFADRPVWVASSTHPGEEEKVLQAHKIVSEQNADSLLVLVPRHPDRAETLMDQMRRDGWHVAQRSTGDLITKDTQVYLADTLGETGLWYHLAPIVFVAGSFTPVGGHNPYEPAHFGCAILTGPLYANFELAYGNMLAEDACIEVQDASDLGHTVADLLTSPRLQQLQTSAHKFVRSTANTRTDVMQALVHLLETKPS
nr:3-deoxy-D-manno-octulosonic acid transferase [uncultured Shimia sp.]